MYQILCQALLSPWSLLLCLPAVYLLWPSATRGWSATVWLWGYYGKVSPDARDLLVTVVGLLLGSYCCSYCSPRVESMDLKPISRYKFIIGVTMALCWYPLVIQYIACISYWAAEVGNGLPLVLVAFGFYWWIYGIYIAARASYLRLDRSRWGDPPYLEPYGFASRWSYYKPKSGHARPKNGGVATVTISIADAPLIGIIISFYVAIFLGANKYRRDYNFHQRCLTPRYRSWWYWWTVDLWTPTQEDNIFQENDILPCDWSKKEDNDPFRYKLDIFKCSEGMVSGRLTFSWASFQEAEWIRNASCELFRICDLLLRACADLEWTILVMHICSAVLLKVDRIRTLVEDARFDATVRWRLFLCDVDCVLHKVGLTSYNWRFFWIGVKFKLGMMSPRWRRFLAKLERIRFKLGLTSPRVKTPAVLPAVRLSYPDVDSCTATYSSSTSGLNWRFRRHIRRVEAKVHARRRPPDVLHPPLPPPEPPPAGTCYYHDYHQWYMNQMNDFYLYFGPDLPFGFQPLRRNNVDDTWNVLVETFVYSHDPSEIVEFLFGVSFDRDRRVSLPLGEAQEHDGLRTLLEPRGLPAYLGSTMNIPLIIDTGASICVSPCREDFISYKKSKVKIKALSSSSTVAGEGLIRWNVYDRDGNITTIEIKGYHIPSAEVRLLSPQALLTQVDGRGYISPKSVLLVLGENKPTLEAYYCPRSNLPLLRLASSDVAPSPRNTWKDAFVYSASVEQQHALNVLNESNTNLTAAQKETLLWHQRLSHASISWIQLLMRDRRWLQSNIPEMSLKRGPFIPCKEPRGPFVDTNCLKCAACLTAKAQVRTPKSDKQHYNDQKLRKFTHGLEKGTNFNFKSLKSGHLQPGDCISADHYISAKEGRLPHTFGRERQGYTCGTLFVDHASGKVFNFCQLTTASSDTIRSKHQLEVLARQEGFSIQEYHSDNGTFASAAYKADCASQSQKCSFSGVGAHHQNGVAERNIRTIAQWARASMLHLAMHWPQVASIKLWPMAMDYAVWVFNRLPNLESGLSPNEIWSSTRASHDDFRRAHVFGCPVYVLEPKLQDGKKIPKWSPRARLGMFLGFSTLHSSLVPLVLNVKTGKISPQYHVIFDDKFETVPSLSDGQDLDEQWNHIFDVGCEAEFFLDLEYDDSGNVKTSHLPDLDADWLDPAQSMEESRLRSRRVPMIPPTNNPPAAPTHGPTIVNLPPANPPTAQPPVNPIQRPAPAERERTPGLPHSSAPDPPRTNPTSHPAPPPSPPVHQQPDFSSNDPHQAPGGANAAPGGDTASEGDNDTGGAGATNDDNAATWQRTRPSRNVGNWKSGPADARRLPVDGIDGSNDVGWRFNICDWGVQPSLPPLVANRGRSPQEYHPTSRISKAFLAQSTILQDSWKDAHPFHAFSAYITRDAWDPDLVDEIDPRILAAKASKYNEDNPDWDMAMNGPFQQEYFSAMQKELTTLYRDLDSWELVPRTPDMNVLPSTWAFKCKRMSDGLISKFKARFCARGDRQKEGIDFFETWAPVVSWTTVRVLMVLAAKLGLKSAQCDITAAFLLSELPEGEDIYVHQPRGFHNHRDEVLKLKRTLYGLKQAPKYFYDYLSTRLQRQGLTPSDFDPCLFLSDKIVLLVYVDDILLYGQSDDDINDFIQRMKDDEDIILNREDTAEGFLGVAVERDGNKTILTQVGLKKRIIEALGLCCSYSTPKSTPAECAPLPRDIDGIPADGTISYASVVGMLLYLVGHTHPECAFAVHQCARYTFEPKLSHLNALKRIGRYLKGVADKGLILDPTDDINIDCYPDADFGGLWSHENPQDPHCVRSRTGYVINLAGCPVVWKSKLQTEIALSTMESEYIALSTSCKELFPLIDLVKELGGCLGLDISDTVNLHVRIHEDNVGALTLGKLEPRRMTPRSKHYAVKYHWFREQIRPRNIQLVKIETSKQLGDLFTKGLPRPAFEYLRRKLMGW